MSFIKRVGSSISIPKERYNEGLRSYMMKVYGYMSAALCVTGISAFVVANSRFLLSLFYASPLRLLFVFAPLGFAIFMSARIAKMSISALHACYWAFSVLMGISLAWVFLRYTGDSVAKVFFITSSMFGAMSIYGYVTKKDLSSIGSFMIMGVVGIIVASLVNIFMRSPALSFAISVIAVVAFTVLTAFDTQRVRECYYEVEHSGKDTMTRVSIMGALTLYFDFINLFVHLLHFLGDRK